jgi:hypothetical protein
LSASLVGCGDDEPTEAPATAPADPMGDISMGCDGPASPMQQQQQVPYKRSQQQSSCTSQQITFPEKGISDFHFEVDCDSRKVTSNVSGHPQSLPNGHFVGGSYPMSEDGSFQGSMDYPQQIPNDGKGNISCWVKYVVVFNGKAGCTRGEDGEWQKSLDVQTTLQVAQGGPSPSPSPSVSPSPSSTPTSSPTASPTAEPSDEPSDGPTSTPTPEPSPSPSPSVSPSASPSPSVSPSPRPSPTFSPIVFCVIDNPCPWVGDGHMSC